MLHACLCTICFVFCYTSWRFYAFSRTNLLTRCHSASSLFFFFCVSEKLHRKYSRNWTKQKPKFLFFPDARRSPKMRQRGTKGRPHHRVARANPWPCHQVVGSPGPPLDTALPPIYFPRWENPKGRSIFRETYCKPPPSSTQDREGPEALPGSLPERGITAEGLLHHHACLRSDV
jgi:hypothetical protein